MRFARVAVPIAVGLLLLEICLRIYNPLPFRVRGDRILLPSRRSYTFTVAHSKKIDPVVHHTKNSLGFRGPEPPRDWSKRLTILTIGGSTTECLFLSDGHTWTDELARRVAEIRPDAWVNNAGLDGHSTFGHLILMRDFVDDLHPTFALFLIGTNDVERGDPNRTDTELTPRDAGTTHKAVTFLADHLETAAVIENVARAMRARQRGFGHSELDLTTAKELHINPPVIEAAAAEHSAKYLPGYEARVTALVALSRQHGIEPVLITQPALYGNAVDPTTGVNLGEVWVNGRGNGLMEWRLLDLYNDGTRRVAEREHVLLVDLARELPKDSRYFYDFLHYTNEGAVKVGDIVFAGLAARLAPGAGNPGNHVKLGRVQGTVSPVY
jgi:hypothetical protein